jgi:hypothetical protein
MNKNVGLTDRYIRFMVGLAFFCNILALNTGVVGTVILLVLGSAMMYTSFSGYCLLYSLIKFNTCEEDTACEEVQQPAGHSH